MGQVQGRATITGTTWGSALGKRTMARAVWSVMQSTAGFAGACLPEPQSPFHGFICKPVGPG